jgi:hypothetical protein
MNKELYDVACKAAEFIKKNHPQAEEWKDIISYCAWYISHGLMVALFHPVYDETIVALACARPVNDPQDGNIPYKYCLDGDCIYIDFMAIEEGERDPSILAAYGTMLTDRFGKREKIAYTRVSVHDYDSFLRNVCRINKIGEGLHEPA